MYDVVQIRSPPDSLERKLPGDSVLREAFQLGIPAYRELKASCACRNRRRGLRFPLQTSEVSPEILREPQAGETSEVLPRPPLNWQRFSTRVEVARDFCGARAIRRSAVECRSGAHALYENKSSKSAPRSISCLRRRSGFFSRASSLSSSSRSSRRRAGARSRPGALTARPNSPWGCLHEGFYRSANSAAWSVFLNSMAMVMGPTPPGTGVMAPATSFTSS